MSAPLPVTVYGPVTPISPSVRVSGVVAGAQVTVKANNTQIGQIVAARAGDLFVPLTAKAAVGETITAVQTVAGETSSPALTSLTCVGVPDPLPVPILLSALNTCMTDVYVDGLVPGASVVSTIGATAFGTAVPAASPAWLGINPTQAIAAGSVLSIVQKVVSGSTTVTSPTLATPPIPLFTLQQDQLPPPELGPLVECDTSRTFTEVTPGARTLITNQGPAEDWNNMSAAYTGVDGPPLKAGAATAVQAMPRCGKTGLPASLTVGPAQVPGPPYVGYSLCPLTLRLQVFNLAPGGVLHLVRQVQPASGAPTTSVIGDVAISAAAQTIDLPPSFQASDPNGPVFVALTQSRCAGASSPPTLVAVTAPGAAAPPPAITAPLYDCSRMLLVTGASPGSNIQAFYPGNLPASDPVCATQPNFFLPLWFPLDAGRKTIEVRQLGCSPGTSAAAPIQAVTEDLLRPPQISPILPLASGIEVTGIVPGARLTVSLNGMLLPGGFDIYTPTATIPLPGAPPVNGDKISVVQTLCQFSSPPGEATVTTGTMSLSVQPGSVAYDDPVQMTVTATATAPMSGMVLAGLPVSVGGTPLGTTGTAFQAPNSPIATVTLTVTDARNGVNIYAPATITYDVVKAPLLVKVTPSSVERGTTTSVTIQAIAQLSLQEVTGLSFTMGAITGQTWTPFDYSPAANAADPTGTVFGGPDFEDQAFSIPLVNPPAPPPSTSTLTINVSGLEFQVPDPSGLGDAIFNVSQLSYTAQPNWAGGAARPGSLGLGANPATATITWPQAPGPQNRVTVTLTGSATTQGVEDGLIQAQSIPIQFAPEAAAFAGAHETIAWLLQSPTVDENGEVSPIIANFAGVSP